MLTFGNWICIICCIIFGILVTLYIGVEFDNGVAPYLITATISAIIIILIVIGIKWYNTHTASGVRAVKDFQSELSNGIEREITITAEDGREIFYYEGKVDIESDHDDNYIKFESEEGKRYIIYYGIQDTITIIEK